MRIRRSIPAVVAVIAISCAPTSTQQWHCPPGGMGYDWTEHNGTQQVIGGDATMYYFAASHDPSVKLTKGPYNC